MLVKVFVTPRKGILDPQGRAVEQSLKSLGFGGVGAVRVGRYIVLELDAPNIDQASESIRSMCDQLLTNPNIEDYTFEIEPGRGRAAMKWGVVRFPGSLDDADALWALGQVMGQEARALWHKDEDLGDVQCVVLPGGFSYGDYLRCGAIARFAPIMKSVVRFANEGGLVLGICNGFQILCEAHLLPGALMRNRSLSFICQRVNVRVENAATPFTCAARQGEVLRLPIKHGEGLYVAPADELRAMEERGQVLLRYTDGAGRERDDANPNGSSRAIAGVANETFNVFGLMPHPEHAVEAALGGEDGLKIFRSIVMSVERTPATASTAASSRSLA